MIDDNLKEIIHKNTNKQGIRLYFMRYHNKTMMKDLTLEISILLWEPTFSINISTHEAKSRSIFL
jgi:hypothetical protein